jgi:hypothetical protein
MQNNLEEYMMQRNLCGLDFMHNYEDEIYCLNQFWRSVTLKLGCIFLET